MKNIRVAFTGTFDIDNYGDHLFPIIFKEIIEKKGVKLEMDLFSPFKAIEGFEQNNIIYSLDELDQMHLEKKYDAIVVGGGEILHLNTFKHLNHENKYIDYPIYKTWIAPSLTSKNNETLVIWNNPGCPFEFKNYEEVIVNYILNYVDYISVRNDYSKDVLKKFGKKIKKSYDTAFMLPYIYPISTMNKKIDNKYVVYHCHKYMDNEFYKESFKVLQSLSKDYEIVLLPLGYTNDDSKLLKKMYEESNQKFHLINSKLSIKEIVSILAHCEMYIGVSFHGAITAYSYGKKVIGYDYFKNNKTKDLFHDLSIDDNYIDELGKLDKVVRDVLDKESNFTSYENIVDNIDTHFNNILDIILNGKKNVRQENDLIFFETLIKAVSDYIENINQEFRNLHVEKENIELNLYNKIGEAQYNLLNWQQCANELITLDEKYRCLMRDYDKINDELASTLKNRIKKIIKKGE